METTKVCKKCGEEKPLSGFYKNAKLKAGVGSSCIDCVLARGRELNRTKTKEERKHRQAVERKRYLKRSKEEMAKTADYQKDYHKKNGSKYRSENKEALRAKMLKWQKENPEKVRGYNKMSLRRQRAEMTDGYCKKLLCKNIEIDRSLLTPKILDLKRQEVLLIREIKKNEKMQ